MKENIWIFLGLHLLVKPAQLDSHARTGRKGGSTNVAQESSVMRDGIDVNPVLSDIIAPME